MVAISSFISPQPCDIINNNINNEDLPPCTTTYPKTNLPIPDTGVLHFGIVLDYVEKRVFLVVVVSKKPSTIHGLDKGARANPLPKKSIDNKGMKTLCSTNNKLKYY